MTGRAWFASLVLVAWSSLSTPAAAMVWPNTIEQVERDLASEDVSDRRKAAEALLELPQSAARRLLPRALADADPHVRMAAAEAAIRVRFEPASQVVRGWLSDREARVRQVAAQVLGVFSPDREAVAGLGRALADPEVDVRLAAAQALGSTRLPEATLALLGHLDDSNPQVQVAVISALERLRDPRSIMPLVGKIQDTRSIVRRAVARALGTLGGPRVVSGLVLALRDSDPLVRVAAVVALGRSGASEAVDALASVLEQDDDITVRVTAVEALGMHRNERTARLVIGTLDSNRAELRTQAQQTLVRIASSVVDTLGDCLRDQPSPLRADGCALALARSGSPKAFAWIRTAWEQRAVSASAALEAFAALQDPQSLPIVLEALLSDDPTIRRHAVVAAGEVLRRAAPDGRAVEPIAVALGRTRGKPQERVALITLLGQTGEPRAAKWLLPFAGQKAPLRLRVAALHALGRVGARQHSQLLVQALEDEHPRIRREAAIALRRMGDAAVAPALLTILEQASQQDRLAAALALAGPLSRADDPKIAKRVARLIAGSGGGLRDALIEALGRMRGAEGPRQLVQLAASSRGETRQKVAEALAEHRSQAATLMQLAADRDSRVRANAVWALGIAGSAQALPLLSEALTDRDVAVAGNAAAAMARLFQGMKPAKAGAQNPLEPVPAALCAALEDERAYVRANVVSALRLLGQRCAKHPARWLVVRDASPLVRQRAARLLQSRSELSPEDTRALERCVAEDVDGRVAAACLEPTTAAAAPKEAQDVVVFVVGGGETQPTKQAPFALVLADDLIRLGVADRRGAVFEARAPVGEVHLEVPAPLAEE